MDAQLLGLIERVMPVLDDQSRRAVLGAAADAIGRGGVAELSSLTQTPYTIVRVAREQMRNVAPDATGRGELNSLLEPLPTGRRSFRDKYPDLEDRLMSMMKGNPAEDPDSPITWTIDSTRQLSKRLLQEAEIQLGYVTVVRVLEGLGFCMQMRTRYGGNLDAVSREKQFCQIDSFMRAFMAQNQPVVMGDLVRKSQGTIPGYSGQDESASNVLTGEEIADIFVSVETWWENMGASRFSGARSLLLLLNGAGWDGERKNVWIPQLRRMARRTGLDILVSLIPPGTFRMNQVGQVLTDNVEFAWENGSTRSRELLIRQIGKNSDVPVGAGCLSGEIDDGWNLTVYSREIGENQE